MSRFRPLLPALALLSLSSDSPAQVKPRADTSDSGVADCGLTIVPTKTRWKGGDSALCDLDGDGAIDHTRVKFNPDGWSFMVQVNQVKAAGSGASLDETFAIVDVDSLDGMREIAVTENEGNPDHVTHFYAYDGIDVFSMGSIPGSDGIEVDGSGIIRARIHGHILHNWSYTAQYRIAKNHRIERVPVDLYPMDAKVVLKRNLALVRSRMNPAAAFTLSAGDTAHIVSSDDVEWCFARNSRGQSGWFSVDTEGRVGPQRLHPQDLFDGLDLGE